MVAAKSTADEFVAVWREEEGSPSRVAARFNTNVRTVFRRRNRLQLQGFQLETDSPNSPKVRLRWHYPPRVDIQIESGLALVCSDAHFWPGEPTPMWVAFCELARALKPDAIILNGDMIDGARISRHPKAPGYSPTLAEELTALRDAFAMLPSAPERYWTVGNHDERVDKYLVNHAPELADYAGPLTDRFPDWPLVWSVVINDDVEVRHRMRGGVHAAWNNVLHSGWSIVTGHTHQLGVRPHVDRRGPRYGVELGMIADPMGAQFQYGEGAAHRWQPGFAVLTFDRGYMRQPELCTWTRDGAVFRGEVIAGKPRIRVKAA